MEKYDLCVIGGGPSGYAAAMRAVDFDKTVLLVERDRLGGAGIYDGALSSKTFWEISKEFASFCKKINLMRNVKLIISNGFLIEATVKHRMNMYSICG